MEIIIAFALAFVVSFLGSVQPGPVNLAVLASSIQKQNRNAVLVAIGGSIPEFIFCYIAIKASYLVLSLSYLFQYFQIALAIIFLIAGIYLWLNKTNITNKINNYNGIVLGLSLAILNPQLIIFWTTVITYIQINNLLQPVAFNNPISLLAFCFGSSLGAFILHITLIAFSRKFITIGIVKFFKYADKTIGTIFIILSIFQIIKLLNQWLKLI